ncbi:MAG: hypothetical protein IT380_10170 [Myxococcales bacterium]|nr:hypothetical protein [Myxococcales bacterium]
MARQEHDYYPTPLDCALAITKRVAEVIPPKRFVYEPSAGLMAPFVKSSRLYFPTAIITAIDTQAAAKQPCLQAGAHGFFHEDYFHYLQVEGGFMDQSLIIGNPPFSLAKEFILSTLDVLPVGSHLAFLLNIRILAGLERAKRLWSRRNLLAWFPLAQRPPFIKNSNDNSDYGVFIWEGGYQGNGPTLAPLIWKPEKLRQPKKNTQKKSKKPTP